ncbi:RsmF rRNA methyltransferase first C-terminal domain-containing protein [Defluviitalea phaphyphila]|uniref:RsmF rRNA methyltransferase first C-terminal domain-containing protein n=1 Tax=Defluviitalea phaphyphila TaxID=1473580 RepID=UPI000731ADDF|nr:RsmB/NOP family class I SAM-dependent RNA methyltransferase [Defluviitalea phaphyphila]
MQLPIEFEKKMKNILKDEFNEYIKSFKKERSYGLRTNTLKITPEELKKKVNFKLIPVPWCKEGFYYKEEDKPAKHPYYHAGLYYIQEPSAMSPGAVLDVRPGDKVLDLCAAPGGKSTQLGAKLKQKGVLFANDISATRVKALIKNIELAGIRNVIITNESPEKLSQRLEGYFDKILIDAPCSGEGMFRKTPEIIKNWESKGPEFYCSIQRDILIQGAKMLKPGGYILYSTCTFSPEENEGIIEEFLSKHTNFEVVPISHKNGFSQGRPDLVEARETLKGAARLWPHKIKGEGHFLVLLRKKVEDIKYQFSIPKRTLSRDILNNFNNFIKENFHDEIKGEFEIHGDGLYLLPEGIPDLRGLRVVRSGWMLGKLKKNRFEPSQSFAMGLNKEMVKNIINFSLEDSNVIKYLKGETLSIEGNKGWNLICVDGYPLGWGKIQNNMLKNKYSPAWRWI